MVQVASHSDDLQLEGDEIPMGSRLEAGYDADPSKPFRGIMIGLVIVTPLWMAIGIVLYFIL